jgi:hypothetical protein
LQLVLLLPLLLALEQHPRQNQTLLSEPKTSSSKPACEACAMNLPHSRRVQPGPAAIEVPAVAALLALEEQQQQQQQPQRQQHLLPILKEQQQLQNQAQLSEPKTSSTKHRSSSSCSRLVKPGPAAIKVPAVAAGTAVAASASTGAAAAAVPLVPKTEPDTAYRAKGQQL